MSEKKIFFLKNLQKIIFFNGHGSPQFSVLSDFLSEHEQSRYAIESMYCALDMLTLTEKSFLAVNYFRDRIYLSTNPFNKNLKIQLLILRNIHQLSLKQSCISYFCQLIAYKNSEMEDDQLPQLFYCPIIYANLTIILRNPLQHITNKSLVLELICLLFQRDDKEILSTMQMSSCNVFPYLVRVLIQPHKELAQHQQFEYLKEKLERMVRIVESNITLEEIFDNTEGGMYALAHFKGNDWRDNYDNEGFAGEQTIISNFD